MVKQGHKRRWAAALLGLVLPFALLASPSATASTLPSGFADRVVLSGLTNPTVVQFATDGRIFVGQKNGVIKVFSSLTDTSPVVFADLSSKVHDFWDRGLLGLALDPGFPTNPYVYVLYAHDAPVGGTAPAWGDQCATPPGPTTDGCVISGRVSRLTASGSTMTGSEQVLIEGWCQQFPSHSVGTLLFGRDGALYASAGDGASFNAVDYGNFGGSYAGDKANPCADPPGSAGTVLTPPTAEGGALRSQSVRRTDGPATLDGTIIRIDPATGAGLSGNPFASSTDPNARRIVGYGLRNPFRFTQRPGSDELWIGDVGWNDWEEINRLTSPTQTAGRNFGWPCYEGGSAQPGYQSAGLNLCSSLYSTAGAVTSPYYTYNHLSCVVSYTGCRTGSSSITGITFYTGGSYPTRYNGSLFFADHTRNEVWAMLPGSNGSPDPNQRECLICRDGSTNPGAGNPIDLKIGPGGDLFYVDMEGGAVHRVTYTSTNQAPTAKITATPMSGPAPLTVKFDGSGSTDPEGGPLSYSWDLDDNGTFGDATTAQPSYTYTTGGPHTATLRVTDNQGASDSSTTTINVGSGSAVIDTPGASLTWQVGQTINFSGHATDARGATVPASGMNWSAIMHHCSTSGDCHAHAIQDFLGVEKGSFSAPDHAYPCWIELKLVVPGTSKSASVRLDPKTVGLTFRSNPGGLKLSNVMVNGGSTTNTTPFTVTAVVGSQNSVSALSPQTLNRSTYVFSAWSDGGAQIHNITAPSTSTTYTATYRKRSRHVLQSADQVTGTAG